jgi:glycosyltransferase involved in cell wall biosynthesis
VLYVGQAYYNSWYLSRSLREMGWKADLLNWDLNPHAQINYHGEDFKINYNSQNDIINYLMFYYESIKNYDVFHFANKGGLQFGEPLRAWLKRIFNEEGLEIRFLKALGKKIVYSNNGCLDGVSQTSFSRWGPENVCSICRWQDEPSVCSDQLNLAWGKFRNEVADFQCTLGGNRADYNKDPRVHEVPEFYCLDPEVWHPKIEIPENYKLPNGEPQLIRLYHAVGNQKERTRGDGVNIKSTHIYQPLIEKMQKKGIPLELISPKNVPNKEVRFLQVQADIFLDMLTVGWFGATAREAMMLGKPVICFLRPEWLESARREIPDYIKQLPIISATPQTVEEALCDLIKNKEKRLELGHRGREFAVRWHSAEAGARRFDRIYRELLGFKYDI